MALNCEDKLAADFENDCDNRPQAGIETSVVLINKEDIDYSASTVDASNDLIITSLALKSGTTGYSFEGVNQINGVTCTFVPVEDNYDGWSHLFAGVILNPSAVNKANLKALAGGGRYVAVVEKKWKGIDQGDAFEVLGWNTGLKVTSSEYNSKESNGVIKFELMTVEGYEEADMTSNLLETDYSTTATAFSNLFATV